MNEIIKFSWYCENENHKRKLKTFNSMEKTNLFSLNEKKQIHLQPISSFKYGTTACNDKNSILIWGRKKNRMKNIQFDPIMMEMN